MKNGDVAEIVVDGFKKGAHLGGSQRELQAVPIYASKGSGSFASKMMSKLFFG